MTEEQEKLVNELMYLAEYPPLINFKATLYKAAELLKSIDADDPKLKF